MTNTTKIIKTIITDNFTSASVSINKVNDGYLFDVYYFAPEVISMFIQRRFNDVTINKQTPTTIEGWFSGIK